MVLRLLDKLLGLAKGPVLLGEALSRQPSPMRLGGASFAVGCGLESGVAAGLISFLFRAAVH